ncbi:MAG: TonB-dependent receptor [Novosphingobium sp.]|nr:TonB-dependent receptor [Novosphingobium sp.]
MAAPAHAQQTEQNVATESDDAFGRTVGAERSGLYSTSDVRGFNPSEAGNVRIEGLYYDLINFLPGRIVKSQSVRVGSAALRYPFPAPTGVIDYELWVPGNAATLSVEVDTGNPLVSGPAMLIDAKLPVIEDKLYVMTGLFARNVTKRPEGGDQVFASYSGVVRFKPTPDVDLQVFNATFYTTDREARATYLPAGDQLPARVPQGKFLGLDWTKYTDRTEVNGGIAHARLSDGLRLDAGLFYTTDRLNKAFGDFLLGVTSEGEVADRLVIASADNTDKSLSGEMRLTREWTGGDFAQRLIASVRGRKRDRRFGGSSRLRLGPGPGTVFTNEGWERPDYTTSAKNLDHVRQLVPGISYSAIWRGRGSLDVSLSKNDYEKQVVFANHDRPSVQTRDKSWLWNASLSVNLARGLSLYGGISRGLEDAAIAPDNAINNSEAPPAIRTRQKELGLRYEVTPDLTLVTGVFEIAKPYYNLDRDRFYRRLGEVTNKGLEFSLTGKLLPGLSIVGGVLLLDPKISGDDLPGNRPVGQVKRHMAANLDWRSRGGQGSLSIDMAFENFSSRTANPTNTLSAPAFSTVNIGARQRFEVNGVKMVLRPQITNLFNAYGWLVSSNGGFTYSRKRTAFMSLVADF